MNFSVLLTRVSCCSSMTSTTPGPSRTFRISAYPMLRNGTDDRRLTLHEQLASAAFKTSGSEEDRS